MKLKGTLRIAELSFCVNVIRLSYILTVHGEQKMAQKYPDPINGFDFIIGRGKTPSYRHNRKLISADKVPEDIKAKLLEEYEKLQAANRAEAERYEAEEKAKEASEMVKDFSSDVVSVDSVELEEPVINDIAEDGLAMTAEEKAILDAYPEDPEVDVPSEIGEDVDVAALKQRVKELEVMTEELVKSSVFEADAELLANQLSERFNVYTSLIGRAPEHSDIHPITAEMMTAFDRGLAYKQFVRATMGGSIKKFGATVEHAQTRVRYENPNPPEQRVEQLPAHYSKLQSNLDREKKDAESYGISGVINDPPVKRRKAIIDPSWQSKGKSINSFNIRDL